MPTKKLPPLPADTRYVRIPLPRTTQNVNRGAFLSDAEPTKPRSIRFTDDDFARITRTCNSLGLSFSEFVRWCSVYGAVEITNDQHRQSFVAGQNNTPPVDKTGWS